MEISRRLPLRILIALAAILLTAGCPLGEPVWKVTGTVKVSVDLQQKFSTAHPARLVYTNDPVYTGNVHYLLAVLCEPQSTALIVPFVDESIGCAKAHSVGARLELFDAEGLKDTPCGIKQIFWPTGDQRAHAELAVAQASQPVFQEKTTCEAETHVDLVLQPIAGH